MAAADHLSPRLFHSTDAFLSPGDLIHPGYDRDNPDSASNDYESAGHPDFAWASKGKPKTSFGRNHYEVEPTGLAHDYTVHETPGGVLTRADSPSAQVRDRPTEIHKNNVVSLAPFRVIRKVNGKGQPKV